MAQSDYTKQRKLKMELSALVNLLKQYFQRLPEVRMVFVFGSAAREMLGPESDIDIAVQFEKIPDAFELQNLKADLADLLKREVDLIYLNQASPILRMQVLKNGILVFVTDQRLYSEFFTDTINQYDDLKRVRRASEEGILHGKIYD
jgi:uncharacterized protein